MSADNREQCTLVRRDRFFVITGGPGAGKTTLIENLRARGIRCVDEVAREIIQTQIRIGGRALPWLDRREFAESIIEQDIANYLAADPNVTTVFDRAIVESLGYAEENGFLLPERLRSAKLGYCYNRSVFIAPPWEAIYATDAERHQDFAEAIRVHDSCARIYEDAGYELIRLPLCSVEERAKFVLERLPTDATGAPAR